MAPTQIRLLPISADHVDGAVALAQRIPFRVDIDDRDQRIGKKVREAEKEWVPLTVVIGDREISGEGPLTVRPRVGEQFTATLDELLERLRTETAGRPHRPANSPLLLSRRPTFVG